MSGSASFDILHHDVRPKAEMQSTLARARQIKQRVAEDHGVLIEEIDGNCRTRPVIAARYEAIAEVRRLCPAWSIARIGAFFNRDHTVILHALDAISIDPTVLALMHVHESETKVAEITGRPLEDIQFLVNSDALREAVLAGKEMYRKRERELARQRRAA